MGFFDKKSRLMRKKIKDLQGELKAAEKQGTYDLKDGIFFAKLQLMGDQTMMAFGAMDSLSASEEAVIEQFFSRNGLHVEELHIDKKTGHIGELEVEPPQELILSMGRELKGLGYRMIDDSERTPRKFSDEEKVFPLSVLLTVATALFAERVRRIISENDHIRNNKEGARLLSWMPEILAYAHQKHGDRAVELAREPFRRAFNKHYLGMSEAVEGHAAAPRPQKEAIEEFRKTREQSRLLAEEEGPSSSASSSSRRGPGFGGSASQARTVTSEQAVESGGSSSVSGGGLGAASSSQSRATGGQAVVGGAGGRAASVGGSGDVAIEHARAEIYRSLVRTKSSRCVRNATHALEHIVGAIGVDSAVLMVRHPGQDGLMLFAQAGEQMIAGSSDQHRAVNMDTIAGALRGGKTVTDAGTMGVPLKVEGETMAVLYLDAQRSGKGLGDREKAGAELLGNTLAEYPDLTLGLM